MEFTTSLRNFNYQGIDNEILCYILHQFCKESYNTFLDLEGIGLKVRDVGSEFKRAPFKDEKTKLMLT